MIYEWIERNRKDIDILTSFLVTAIPVVMLYSEALGITENTIPYLQKAYDAAPSGEAADSILLTIQALQESLLSEEATGEEQ